LNPKVEKLKQELDKMQAKILEVGGHEYGAAKQQLDQIQKAVFETERLLTRNKTTVQSSASNLRKLD
jgi:uncharacterized protein YecA (UPF0149 family)